MSNYTTFQDNTTHGEDSFLVRDLGGDNYLDVVLDGVTGHGGGEASRGVAGALGDAPMGSVEDLLGVIEEQNSEFYQVGGGRFLLTTITAVLCLDGSTHVVHAGDSPFYLVKTDSHQQISGRIGGLMRPGSTKVIGSAESLDMNVVEVFPDTGDRILLATDGVSDNLSVGELVETIRAGKSPQEVITSIENMIKERLEGGTVPHQMGGRYRHDDQTGIIRFL